MDNLRIYILAILLTACGAQTTNEYSITNNYSVPDGGVEYIVNGTGPEATHNTTELDAMAMNDGWSGSGWLATGRGTMLTPNGDRTQTDVQLNAIFSLDEGGSGAKYYTVQIGVRPPGQVAIKPVAKVTWRTKGRTVTRRVDAGNGVVVSGTAQACDVSVADDTDVTGVPPDVPQPYYVDILITPGARPSTQQPPRLSIGTFELVASPGPGNTETLSIPPDAGAISFNVQAAHDTVFGPILPGELEVQLNALLGGTFAIIDFTQLHNWEQLLPSVNELKFINHSATPILVSLTLGIEG